MNRYLEQAVFSARPAGRKRGQTTATANPETEFRSITEFELGLDVEKVAADSFEKIVAGLNCFFQSQNAVLLHSLQLFKNWVYAENVLGEASG